MILGLEAKSFQAVIEVSIVAEMYLIYDLRNQNSDAIQAELSNDRWKLTLELSCRIANILLY